MTLAIGLTIFLVVRYRDTNPDPNAPVVAKSDAKAVKGPPAAKPAADPRPADSPTRSRIEEEEEVAAIPARERPPKKGPPDLGDLLPKLPQLGPKDPPPESRPKDPPAPKTDSPVAAKPMDPCRRPGLTRPRPSPRPGPTGRSRRPCSAS